MFSEIMPYIPFLVPIIVIQLGMAVYALLDLARRAKTRGPRWLWAVGLLVTVLGIPSGIIVSGLYLAWGRHAEV
jgi:Zn-dependent protease with chaperone function